MTDPDVVVLRQKIHGMSAEGYADAIRDHLPGATVAVARTPDEERELLTRATVATGLAIEPDSLADAANLELFACVYAGTGHLSIEAFEERGVAVTNASGVHGPNIAEHVVGSILLFVRGFDRAWRRKERREWRSFQARELAGSTVAVVGLGAIGETVVDRLEPFGVDTIGVRYSSEKGGPTDEVLGYDDLHDALARSEYVVIAAPLTETTRGLFDEAAFRTMRPDAVLVNVGRGPVVDTDALVDAVRTNAVRGAALDVTDPEPLPEDHPLWTFDNVFVTPHNAGHTPAYWDRLADVLAGNVRRLDAGETDLENQVI
ncbi:D-2-hydroxyacid dehydrogenase [Halegenticoccus tardaugens]|uniref:D-2-hydroxyacid dehydrogenase n=1 Tax=Halegenticoccus tardaugens TaxID=2071624 RepID=UPI00100B5F12|nr:D-2-hydroxyacid dehydrogenase [Halegenticoccus tardaugens]